uniref:RAB20, member RAS oncogene family n=1 Tax=Strix occidentalis caurina TaxID=311401 RepID=A0A8D0FQZ1_STROC
MIRAGGREGGSRPAAGRAGPSRAAMKKPDGKVVLLGDMNVGKTSLLHRYMERRFQETVSTVGGAFYLKQWGPYNISIWDTAGREQFHGLGSMYCRGAAAVILTYDVNSLQSLTELEERFLALTDSASADCIFAIVGNKSVASCSSKVRKQVRAEDKMCFETSAKTGYKVDYLFETVFEMVVPIIVRQKAEGPPQTVDITDYKPAKRTKSGCCA